MPDFSRNLSDSLYGAEPVSNRIQFVYICMYILNVSPPCLKHFSHSPSNNSDRSSLYSLTLLHTVKGQITKRVTTKPLPLPWIIFRARWHVRVTYILTGPLSCHSDEQKHLFSEGLLYFSAARNVFNLCLCWYQTGFSYGGLLNTGHWSGQSGRTESGTLDSPLKCLREFYLAVSSVTQENMASLWTERASDCGSALLWEMSIIRYVLFNRGGWNMF